MTFEELEKSIGELLEGSGVFFAPDTYGKEQLEFDGSLTMDQLISIGDLCRKFKIKEGGTKICRVCTTPSRLYFMINDKCERCGGNDSIPAMVDR